MPRHSSDVLCIRCHEPARLERFVDATPASVVWRRVTPIGHASAPVTPMRRAFCGGPAAHRAYRRDIEAPAP